MQADAHRQDQSQRPERAGEQLCQVIARDVLDHLSSGTRNRPVAQCDGHAEHQVPRRAVAVAERARVPGGKHAANRGLVSGAEERVERQHLARGRELGLRAGKRDAGLEYRREVALVVLDDPVEPLGSQVEVRGLGGRAPSRLAAAAHDSHGLASRGRTRQRGGGRVEAGRAKLARHQNLVATPARSSGCSL